MPGGVAEFHARCDLRAPALSIARPGHLPRRRDHPLSRASRGDREPVAALVHSEAGSREPSRCIYIRVTTFNGQAMDTLARLARRYSPAFLRFSLALVLLWIGALKFVDPSPVVGLLDASLTFLGFPAFVYLLGAVEVVAAGLLVTGVGVRYVGVVLLGLFAGTLLIFLIAPAVTYGDAGFPRLSLAGEFLLKDLVLMAAASTLVALDDSPWPEL